MSQHSRYIEYANAIAERDGILGMVLIYVLCIFVLTYAVTTVFPRVKREWFVLGAFYATFLIVGIIPSIAGY
jgi:hypothetical protein